MQIGASTERQLLTRISAKLDVFASQVDDLTSEVKVVTHNQKRQLSDVATPARSAVSASVMVTPAGSSPIVGDIASDPPVKKARVLKQITLPSAQFTGSNVVVRKPATTLTVGACTVAGLFFNWYLSKLYIMSAGTTESAHDQLIVCAKVIAYCKCFLDPGTIIECLPVADVVAADAWNLRMGAMSRIVEDRIIAHIHKHLRKLLVNPKVQGTYKLLRGIPIASFPVVAVVDAAYNAVSTGKCYHYPSIAVFR